jgi:hypothetical protein
VSILLVVLGALVLAALFAEIRDKRRLTEAVLHASETQRYLIETERDAAARQRDARRNAISLKPRETPPSAVSSRGLPTRSTARSASALRSPRRSRSAARPSPTRSPPAIRRGSFFGSGRVPLGRCADGLPVTGISTAKNPCDASDANAPLSRA